MGKTEFCMKFWFRKSLALLNFSKVSSIAARKLDVDDYFMILSDVTAKKHVPGRFG